MKYQHVVPEEAVKTDIDVQTKKNQWQFTGEILPGQMR